MKATTEKQVRNICDSMILVMRSKRAGNLAVALAAEVIIADARFNYWFREIAKETLSEQELLRILEQGEGDLKVCNDAAERFDRDGDFAQLEATLKAVLGRLVVSPYLDLHALRADFEIPHGLTRVLDQRLVTLSPWHILTTELAQQRHASLRTRYTRPYVPFARRQDNDDLACVEADAPAKVVVIHDFAGEGTEVRQEYPDFWSWFRRAIDDMIEFE